MVPQGSLLRLVLFSRTRHALQLFAFRLLLLIAMMIDPKVLLQTTLLPGGMVMLVLPHPSGDTDQVSAFVLGMLDWC